MGQLEGAFAPVEERVLTDTLGFTYLGDGEYRLDGDERHFHWAYDQAQRYGEQGAGTVHHIAWATRDEDHLAWQERVRDAGGFVTEVRDRDYFRSIYFREPRGVLFEIATMSPGFAIDETSTASPPTLDAIEARSLVDATTLIFASASPGAANRPARPAITNRRTNFMTHLSFRTGEPCGGPSRTGHAR